MATRGPEVSLQSLMDKFNLSQDQLDQEISEEHLRKVSRIIDDHVIVGYELELSKSETAAINHDERTQERQRLAMLRQWKQKVSWNATYCKLIKALLECRRADHAREVCELLSQSENAIEDLRSQLQREERETENLRCRLQQKEKEIQEMASENRDIQRENESLRKEARSLRNQIQQKERESENLKSRLQRKEREIQEMALEKRREFRDIQRENESLRSQILQKEGAFTKMKKEIEHFQNKLTRMNGPSDYYDILLLGLTGRGKSTTGNKLLGISSEGCGPIRLWSTGEDAVKYFKADGGGKSVTNECKLLSNTSGIRVLDTPGFAYTPLTKKLGVMEANKQVLRWILQEQRKHNLVFRRVLYFLPHRRPPECVDGSLLDEIQVMYEFWGMDIFNIMVIIAICCTARKIAYDEEDIEQTKRVLTVALKRVTGQHLPKCPPVLYLPFEETDIVMKIKSVAVIEERSIKAPVFGVLDRSEIDTVIHNNSGRRVCFRVACSRCTGKLIFETSPTGQKIIMIGYEDENGVLMTYSKCHPVVPVTTSLIRIVATKVWPGFANFDDKRCPVCNLFLGSHGCTDVGAKIRKKERVITVSHSTCIDDLV